MFLKLFIVLVATAICADCLTIISKSEWGGRAATSKSNLANGLAYAVVHHTESSACTTKTACSQQMRNIQDYHQKTLGWADIGYNFLIGGDNNVYEGRGWNTLGAHASNWNSKSLGISFIGNYMNQKPTTAQVAVAKELLAMAVSKGQIKSNYILYGHRQVGSTDCPGTHLWAEIQKWPNWQKN